MGSMKDFEKKHIKKVSIGAAVIIAAIVALCYIIPNDLHSFFLATKSWTKYLGLVLFAAAFFMVYKSHNATVNEKSSGSYWIGVLILLGLGIATACGFDFSYLRIK